VTASADGDGSEPPETCFAWAPSSPRPGEGLLGWLLREASDQHVPSIGVVLAHATSRTNLRPDQRIGARLDVAALATVTMVTPDILEPLLYPSIDEERIRFLGASVPRWHLEAKRRRFSPSTLATEGVCLAAWEHKFLPFCPLGWEFLTDRCPECATRQTWHWAVGIDICPKCGSSLTIRTRRTVPKEWQSPLSVIAGLTQGRTLEELLDGALPPVELRHADPGDVLELIHAMFPFCGAKPLNRSYSAWWRRRPLRLARTLAEAASLVLGWPEAAVARLASRAGDAGGRSTRAMGHLLQGRGLRDGSLAERLIGDLARGYRADGIGRVSNSSSGYTVGATMRLLGTDTGHVSTARRRGHLRAVPLLRRAKLLMGFDREDVDRVADVLRHRASAWHTAAVLGLPLYAAEDLANEGVLSPCRHPYIVDFFGPMAFDRRHLDALVEELQAAAVPHLDDAPRVVDAVKRISGSPKPWACLLSRILSDNLPMSVDPGHGPILTRMRITRESADDVLAAHHGSDPSGDPQRILGIGDALEMLNLTGKRHTALKAAVADPTAIRLSEVAALGKTFISCAEIAARWGLHHKRASSVLRTIAPHLVHGPLGWPRDRVEAFSACLAQARRRLSRDSLS